MTAKRFARQFTGDVIVHLLFASSRMRGLSIPLPDISSLVKGAEGADGAASSAASLSSDHMQRNSAAFAASRNIVVLKRIVFFL